MSLENLETLSNEELIKLGKELQAKLFHIEEILDLRYRATLDENY